jgi:hypothetical protein
MDDELVRRFPAVELSYETHHKKVTEEYDVALAIPYGKKAFLWCTVWREEDVCVLLELNRDRRICKTELFAKDVPHPWVYGTVLYGVLVEEIFVVEDILQSRGICLQKLSFGEKLPFFREMMETWNPRAIRLPYMSTEPVTMSLPYVTHHMQYRSLTAIVPYINVDETKITAAAVSAVVEEDEAPRCDFKKPQYRKPAVFAVEADVQFDLYRLYASERKYYGLAYIPNYRVSVMMNGLFRRIRENDNLDLLEESDDEEDFQDCRPTKYVDLEKCVRMRCDFHPKFKRWIPREVVGNDVAVVSMSFL